VTQELTTIAQVESPEQIWSKRKAITALFPYAVWRERDGEHGMVDAVLGAARTSSSAEFMWNAVGPFSATLFGRAGPDSLNRVITLASPHMLPSIRGFDETMVTRWAATVSTVPYTEEVGQAVVDALLQIASIPSIQRHIPVDIWSRLNKRPSLPPVCRGRSRGSSGDVVCQVRALGDIGILKSYLFLVWSEWDHMGDSYRWPAGPTKAQADIQDRGLNEMRISIWEDFGGIEMGYHREDLIKRLDHVLEQLGQGLGHLKQQKPSIDEDEIRLAIEQYGELKEVLLEVDREATRTLTRTPSGLILLFGSLTPAVIHRIPLNICLCAPTSVFVAVRLGRSPNSILRLHMVSPPLSLFATQLVTLTISDRPGTYCPDIPDGQ
jgi:hypothetical protein